MDTPPIVEPPARPSKPTGASGRSGRSTAAGSGRAPGRPQLRAGELYRNSEQGSFWSTAVLSPVMPPTYIIPVSGSTAAPPSMFTPPDAPGAYHEHGCWLVPSFADGGM